MGEHIHSYSKIFNLGHPEVSAIFNEENGNPREVRVEEKVDGSQFSFKRDEEGIIRFRSKNADIFPEAAGMFQKGVDHILNVSALLVPGFTYRAEYLQKPKHNALSYERIPLNHIVLYDIEKSPYVFADRFELQGHACALDVDVIPLVYQGNISGAPQVKDMLDRESFLGKVKIEGVVVKPMVPYFGRDNKAVMAKYVSEAFKETHQKSWKDANPGNKDILGKILEAIKTERSWEKAVERVRDAGELESSPRDIGKIIKEVQKDVFDENEAQIKEILFKWARKNLSSSITGGLPEWYKGKLLEKQFEVQDA